ncbi:MAG: hypothetical protein ISN29_12725 [Gammaproteobacteria bacterium AqS3]|nr:hypothetical protein [Gammaproteobacteria bacterium AqS3]
MMPKFHTGVIFQKKIFNVATTMGTQRRGTSMIRVLQASSTFTAANITEPNTPAPDTHLMEPAAFTDSAWTAWWPSPPARDLHEYKIPDPPKIARPIDPTPSDPILWECQAPFNSSRWEKSISAIFMKVDWEYQSGREQISSDAEMEIILANIKSRPKPLNLALVNIKDWEVKRVDDGSRWDMESMVSSYHLGDFKDIVVREAR